MREKRTYHRRLRPPAYCRSTTVADRPSEDRRGRSTIPRVRVGGEGGITGVVVIAVVAPYSRGITNPTGRSSPRVSSYLLIFIVLNTERTPPPTETRQTPTDMTLPLTLPPHRRREIRQARPGHIHLGTVRIHEPPNGTVPSLGMRVPRGGTTTTTKGRRRRRRRGGGGRIARG